MHSITEWEIARSPNYDTNVDKAYPYSEVPYIGKYKLVKIPQGTTIPLVDYWGEGRLSSEAGDSGFPDCFNVNHPHQTVSNGPDRGRKIPNRVPVQSYTTCDTSSYIKQHSALVVTLMGAPINDSCAKDIKRMVNKTKGIVVVFGFQRDSADIRNLDKELREVYFIYCHDFKLPISLKGLTLFDNLSNPGKLKADLRSHVVSGNYADAVNLSKSLSFSSYDDIISTVVNDLLRKGNKNVCSFAYQLWNNDAQSVVLNYFPLTFKLILNGSLVKIIDKKNNQALKLALASDSDNDKEAWGDGEDQTSERVSWKLFPVWSNNRVFFRLMNTDCGMFLKLAVEKDSISDRAGYGDLKCKTTRHSWYLDPVISGENLLFFIVNLEYGMGLKLAVSADDIGDRRLWGHHSEVHDKPESFGWHIQSW